MNISAHEKSRAISRVMIVDDHALVRHGVAELISHEPDLEVCGDAEDSDDALREIESSQPHLVVLDVSLKSTSGIELIKRIQLHHEHVRILVLSMHDESLFAERALRAGAHGYINKQAPTEKVIAAMRHVLQGKIYLSPQITDLFLHRFANGDPATAGNSVERLSDRELEVFGLIGQGLSTREIAERLHLSVKTIETHREHIKEKLGLKSGAELSRHAVQWALENH